VRFRVPFPVAFDSIVRPSLSAALPQAGAECKRCSKDRRSVSAATDVKGAPRVKLGVRAGSAIQDGNPPIVPSGSSQKMYSPRGSFALRRTRRFCP
jgi:hypothetical protein